MSGHAQIQKLLNEHLTEAQLKNPLYSLRSFAKKVGLPASALSEIMNGKRRLSREKARGVLNRLCVDPDLSARILGGFPEKMKYNRRSRDEAVRYTRLDMDHFRVVSDWHHFAILSLSETEGYRHDPKWIARRLGIRAGEASLALDRLERLGMLERDEKTGKVIQTGVSYATSDDVADLSLRKAHAQNLELARRSLEGDAVDERDFTAITMAIDPEMLPLAKKMIREFRDRLCATLESGAKKEVHKFCMQLIPLTKRGVK